MYFALKILVSLYEFDLGHKRTNLEAHFIITCDKDGINHSKYKKVIN
jgi:hypothetical protein